MEIKTLLSNANELREALYNRADDYRNKAYVLESNADAVDDLVATIRDASEKLELILQSTTETLENNFVESDDEYDEYDEDADPYDEYDEEYSDEDEDESEDADEELVEE